MCASGGKSIRKVWQLPTAHTAQLIYDRLTDRALASWLQLLLILSDCLFACLPVSVYQTFCLSVCKHSYCCCCCCCCGCCCFTAACLFFCFFPFLPPPPFPLPLRLVFHARVLGLVPFQLCTHTFPSTYTVSSFWLSFLSSHFLDHIKCSTQSQMNTHTDTDNIWRVWSSCTFLFILHYFGIIAQFELKSINSVCVYVSAFVTVDGTNGHIKCTF